MSANNSNGGSRVLWVWLTPLIILAVSYAAAAIAYPFLPPQIPYHLNLNGTQSLADKNFIYLFALLPTVIYLAIRAKYRRR